MLTDNFKYPGLLKYFEKISAIPRPSFHEEKIADYLCDFAAQRSLECYRDAMSNVFIKLPATPGREDEDAILLQGHTDMVCEKNSDVEHDFMNEGIKLCAKDGWIRADGTTLGADNGVAVASMLYILDGAEGNIPSHPAIECLFTVCEEVGLEGADNFDYSRVSATRMINLDSADESQIIAGCAGGERSELSLRPDVEPIGAAEVFTVAVRGLAGGHSGEDINRGRANANKLLGRILMTLGNRFDVRIVDINGGSKDNAIPREAEATVAVNDGKAFENAVSVLAESIASELCRDDAAFSVTVRRKDEKREKAMTRDSSSRLLFLLGTAQNGIFEMNTSIKDLVEFSRNLGVVETAKDLSNVSVIFFSRSSQDSQMDFSSAQLDAYAERLGMTHTVNSRYPGWRYAEKSAIRDSYSESYEKLFGSKPEILTIHAGLECGIISEKLPGLDIISCGPIILDLHSPDEALNVASFERFFTVIKEVLVK